MTSLGSEPYWQAQHLNRVHTQVGPQKTRNSNTADRGGYNICISNPLAYLKYFN
jgi:hypothetical protein